MVKGYMGLLECMESYVVSVDASLVVMGSQAIVSQPLCPSGIVSAQAVVGSVTLSCMKRLRLPMAIVTPQTRLHASAAQAQARLRAPRALAIVEPHSRPMLDYLCTHCLVSCACSNNQPACWHHHVTSFIWHCKGDTLQALLPHTPPLHTQC